MPARMIIAFALCAWVPSPGFADPAPPMRRVDLTALLAMVDNTPKQQMAEADVAAARAQLREITAMAGPKATMMAYLAPSPDIECLNADCTRTDPTDPEFGASGVALGLQLQIVQPLASFGKAGPAKRAAKAGIEARVALADASRADLMQDVARAYWGLKFAREVQFFLQDGLDELAAAKTRLQDRIASGDADVTPLDERRVETLMAEASMQLADAVGAERTALAALRTLAGDAAIDIDEAPFVAVSETLLPLADWLQTATAHRPELRAAKAGSRAMGELATLQARMLAPNLALVAGYRGSIARGLEDPPSFYANDPYNSRLGTVALVLQWTFEPLARGQKICRGRTHPCEQAGRSRCAIGGD
ncbi:MAG: TolC family protein [Myxococcales bacterium]|nr:TolC family protein [Myxococcales bacterium]